MILQEIIEMSKDPAVLLYTSDFLTGTAFFSDAERGQYIRLLCEQHQIGHIPENHMLTICLSLGSPVAKKFVKDENGMYYNVRMEEEIQKRLEFTDSRRLNGLKGGRPRGETKASGLPIGLPSGYPTENLPDNDNDDEEKGKGAGKEKDWRNDFETYLSHVKISYECLIADEKFIKKQENFYPGVDIYLSLQKSVDNFWGTEAGWKHKKTKKSKEIDMKSTLTNAISMNKVYRKPINGQQFNQHQSSTTSHLKTYGDKDDIQ